MKNYVYVLTWEGTQRGEVLGANVRVFADKESAMKVFNATRAEDLNDAKEWEWEIEEGDMYYSYYESGEYSYNHFECSVKKLGVEKL